MTRTLTLAAVTGYATGTAIGLAACWALWVKTSHEHRFRIMKGLS